MRERLEALLQAQENTLGVTEQPAEPPSKPTMVISLTPSEQPGDRISHYKLLQEIGEGGCGVVYMAEQEEPVRRRVALKVIKLGMDTKSVIARFEPERQALAMMDHPNIAKVLDAGTTGAGRPFFVMELVRGVKITEYGDKNHLATRERLGLFIQVCHAIQHAHQKGIIHRDIKPSNILVTLHDGEPIPKVSDFGIAKATDQRLTDKTLFTQFESFIGTPAYMSPEQAEMSGLDIDTRSDIYALGVLLYELLTGRTPFDPKELAAGGLEGMRRTIREQEPVRPSTRLSTMIDADRTTVAKQRRVESLRLVHLLRGDLDWIVMKALEKDRTRRYETANGMAMDIQRHLNHEPIVARPPSRVYRFQKMVQRNKLAVAASVAVAAALIFGRAFSTWQFIGKSRAYQRALAAEQEQNRLTEQAEKTKAEEARLRRQAEAQEQAAQRYAYASDMNLVQQALAANNMGRAQDLLRRHRPGPGQPDLPGWEWRYLWQQCQSDALFTLCQKPNSILSLAVSPDGRLAALGEQENGGLSVWDLATREQVVTLAAGERMVRVAFSPSGTLLAYSFATGMNTSSERYGIRLWEDATRRVVAEFELGGLCMGLGFHERKPLIELPSRFMRWC